MSLNIDHHIHYGTSSNPNPYEFDMSQEDIAAEQSKRDEIIDSLTTGDDIHLPDYFEGNEKEMLEDIFTIMADGEDDKEGRIRDYIRVHAEHYADWKIENDRRHGE